MSLYIFISLALLWHTHATLPLLSVSMTFSVGLFCLVVCGLLLGQKLNGTHGNVSQALCRTSTFVLATRTQLQLTQGSC